jgi:DNA-directed RNA polymerase sigma subunit (sigma70/sigma32)
MTGEGIRRREDASERALVLAAQEGRPQERHELVQRFMPLIDSMARRYRGLASIERRELRQEGVLGILRALERYDPELGTPFWSYASWWVRQAMQRLVSELSGSIVLSDRAFRQLARLKEAERSYLQNSGRHPGIRELAERVGLSVEHVQSLLSAERRARPLHEPAHGADPSAPTVADTLADPSSGDGYERVCGQAAAERLPELLAELDERERGVLLARYGLAGREWSLRELGATLGVSAERVRQIESATLQKLNQVAAAPH